MLVIELIEQNCIWYAMLFKGYHIRVANIHSAKYSKIFNTSLEIFTSMKGNVQNDFVNIHYHCIPCRGRPGYQRALKMISLITSTFIIRSQANFQKSLEQ